MSYTTTNQPTSPVHTPRQRARALFAELRRRRVFKTSLIYIITGWVVVQVAATVAPLLKLPDWTPGLVLLLVVLGFPLMLVLSWSYDIEPASAAVAPTAAVKPAERATDTQSIAVLPFVDMSPDCNQGHFSDGIAEEILNVLARLPHLRVAARTSAFAFKGKSEDVRRIGEQLGVGTVLEGSVRAAGNRIRITAQLVDVSNGYHLWSERYDRELGDVFAIQDEIAGNIVAALNLKISGDQQPRTQAITENMEAYDYYLRGRSYLMQLSRQGLEQARIMFRAAIERDPAFAAAHASTAEAASLLYLYWDPRPDNLSDAHSNAERAIRLAPDDPQARLAHAIVLSLERHYDEAAGEFEAAVQLDPLFCDAYYQYGRSRWAAGDLPGAVQPFKRAAELRPDDSNAISLLFGIYDALGMKEEAQAALVETLARVQRTLQYNPDDPRALYKGAFALAMLGQRERGIEWAERAVSVDPGDAATWYNVACIYVRIGEYEQALEKLEKAIRFGFRHREWIVNDSDWLPLQNNARFVALMNGLKSA